MKTRGQVVEQGQIFGNDTHTALDLQHFVRVEHVLAQHGNCALRRRQQAGQHLDRGRFAGPIGTKKPIEGTAFHTQIDGIDRENWSK